MNRKENVRRAVHFENPEYIPLMFYSLNDIHQSDLVSLRVVQLFGGSDNLTSEWGFVWEPDRLGYELSQIKTPALPDWSGLRGYRAFDVNRPGRFNQAREIMAHNRDRYFIADFGLSGFTVSSFMRGFENFMVDLYDEPARVEELLDVVFGQEEALIRACAKQGFDAVGLADDWGTQQSLMISHDMFLKYFKPRFKHEIDVAHGLGLDVYMHSCGHITGVIQDLVDVGLDILNPGQPSLNGVQRLGNEWAGKICFVCPVSYQTTGISGSADDVEKEIRDYGTYLATGRGGLIGLVARGLETLGSTPELQETVLKTWLKYYGRENRLPVFAD